MSDHRPFRVPARLPVVETDNGAHYYTKNLSLGGLFLLADRRWAVGSNVKLKLNIEDGTLDVEARVTHIQADGVGFSFVSPSVLVQETLRSLIEEQVRREPAQPGNQRVRVEARAAWADKEERHDATVRDLSIGGAFIESDELPEQDAEIMVYLPAFAVLDGKRDVAELRGSAAKVVRRTAEGAALQFLTPSAEFRMAVHELLSKALLKR